MPEEKWVRIIGSGLVYSGHCHLTAIIFWPDADADYVDIYDGRDATSGKKFCRIETSFSLSWHFNFSHPLGFDMGIYVDGIDDAVETTVCFIPDPNREL